LEKTVSILLLIALLFLAACKGKSAKDGPEEYSPEYQETPSTEEPAQNDSSRHSGLDLKELKAYQYNWSESDDLPPLVIVIDDFGQISGQLLEDFTALPQEVAFAILPDLPNTQAAARLADKTGHEVLIHVPMQPLGNDNPGKRYIKKGMEAADIADLLQEFYSQMPNAIAANNHMGSAATADYSVMQAVLEELHELGLFFLDSATTNKSAVPSAASALGYKTAKRDIFLDVPDNSDATLIGKIQSLGKYKGRNEPIVIITHCHTREKLNALNKFIAQISDMGLKLIPPSKLYKKLSPPA